MDNHSRVQHYCGDLLNYGAAFVTEIVGLVDTSERTSSIESPDTNTGNRDQKPKFLLHLATFLCFRSRTRVDKCISPIVAFHFCTTRLQYVIRIEVINDPRHRSGHTLRIL